MPLLIPGQIEMKSGSALTEFTAIGLKFADGTEIPADVIVFATGYATGMKQSASQLLDPEVAEKLDESWLLDEEGNPRGSWKPIGRKSALFEASKGEKILTSLDPNVWFCPGDISHSRFFSRFIALQIKAEVEGKPFIPYTRKF